MPAADGHVHSEWSWDAGLGSMETACERAIELGLPALAFTDHADFTPWAPPAAASVPGSVPPGTRILAPHSGKGLLDVHGYWDCLDRCRELFPQLRILSGVELGEAHRFPAETAAVLAVRPFDRVLGSVHCIPFEDRLVDVSSPGFLDAETALPRTRTYFTELLALVERAPVFGVLAHLTYPKRFWPQGLPAFREEDFQEEIRAILTAAVRAGMALEINTTRGLAPERGLCPAASALRWWIQAGGDAVCFGSDAHDPTRLAAGFARAAGMVEGAGFHPSADPAAFWLR